MSPGGYISAVGHAALIIWLLAGWGLSHDPLPFEVTEVSVVSGEEYEAIVAARTPNPVADAPITPALPEPDATPETPTPTEEAAPTQPQPEAAPAPEPDSAPEEVQPAPEPPAAVAEVAPAQPTALIPPSAAVDTNSDTPTPRPATRVADTPSLPSPDTAVAPVEQAAVTPDTSAEAEVVTEEQEAAAPEEATTEIVTEAEKPSGAVESSIRPTARPRPQTAEAKPAETPAKPQTPATSSTATEDAVAAAVAAAAATASAPAASSAQAGPPMTGGEKDAFRLAVNACWNVDPGAEWARVTVTVGFSLGQDGRVVGDVRMISATGGNDAQTSTAFQAARRAILRCQSSGYKLPPEKYDQWQNVEITFDPSGMRLR
jgi:hypothetical protein